MHEQVGDNQHVEKEEFSFGNKDDESKVLATDGGNNISNKSQQQPKVMHEQVGDNQHVDKEEFSFGNKDDESKVLATDGGNNISNKSQQQPKVMPPTSVMTRLILVMVWRKLICNPNSYSSLFGDPVLDGLKIHNKNGAVNNRRALGPSGLVTSESLRFRLQPVRDNDRFLGVQATSTGNTKLARRLYMGPCLERVKGGDANGRS